MDQKEENTGKRRFSVESIVAMLRVADVMIGKGMTLSEILRYLNISDDTQFFELSCACTSGIYYWYSYSLSGRECLIK